MVFFLFVWSSSFINLKDLNIFHIKNILSELWAPEEKNSSQPFVPPFNKPVLKGTLLEVLIVLWLLCRFCIPRSLLHLWSYHSRNSQVMLCHQHCEILCLFPLKILNDVSLGNFHVLNICKRQIILYSKCNRQHCFLGSNEKMILEQFFFFFTCEVQSL